MKATTLQAIAPRAIAVSVLLFGASPFASFFPDMSAIEVFLLGWKGALHGENWVAVLVWWATLPLVMTWTWALLSSNWKAILAGSIAALLGLCSLVLVVDRASPFYSESHPVRALGLGYWLWFASVAVGFGGAITGALSDRVRASPY